MKYVETPHINITSTAIGMVCDECMEEFDDV